MSKETEWLRHIKEKISKQSTLDQTLPQVDVVDQTDMVDQLPKRPIKHGLSRIAGMESLKRLINEGFINVLKNPKKASLYGVTVPNVLLYGPSGCGKTYFAECLAEEVGINFMKVCPDDLSSIYMHGTQKLIGELFKKAEAKAPTLLFFDEFDCMVPSRTNEYVGQRLSDEVDEFLTMLNNTSKRGIYVVAATNHPERIDSSILRTGRIDEKIYVPMPDKKTRETLFRLELSSRPVSPQINYDHLAKITEGYNCSDISYMVNCAARMKFNHSIVSSYDETITQDELEYVISNTIPSVSEREIQSYEELRRSFSSHGNRVKTHRIGFVVSSES